MIFVLSTTVGAVHERSRGHGGAAALVSSEDLTAARARRGAHGDRTLAGRAALRLLLAHVRGDTITAAPALAMDRTCERCGAAHGRPRAPGLSVSSATSENHVLVGVGGEEMRIGVDVQALPATLWSGFDATVFHPRERRSDQYADIRAHIALWTRKEAVLKAAGVGLLIDPARLHLDTSPGPETTWWDVGEESPAQLQGLQVRDLPGAVPRAVASSVPAPVRWIGLDEVLPAV